MRNFLAAGLIAGLSLGAAVQTASATTISVSTFGIGDLAGFNSAYTSASGSLAFSEIEDFETIGANGQVGALLSTSVGDFSSVGGTGSGQTVTGDGTQLALRNDDDLTQDPNRTMAQFGRYNLTEGGSRFLDSNDTLGIRWVAQLVTGGLFDRIIFGLTDVSDVGATMTIAVNGTDQQFTIPSRNGQNGLIDLVVIAFSEKIDQAVITLTNNQRNDGFGIDSATIGAIPLPAGGLLLLTALGGLAFARRRVQA